MVSRNTCITVSSDPISRFIHTFIPTVFVLMAVVLNPARVQGQTTADLFNPDVVQEIRLSINSRDLLELHERYQENTYYTADLSWQGQRVRNVGVRSRGTGSRNPIKLGLRVDFDRYTTGQTFLGLRSLILDNNWQDPSLLAERAAMAFFERLGQPAPRESYCRLYINNGFEGLYSIVESIDAPFLARVYDSDQGYLFRFDYQAAWHGEYLGDDLALYKPFFEPETHKLEADVMLYAPIRDLFREANGPDDAVWRERVEQFIDLRQLVRHVAIETFLSEDDGFIGAFGMNNFYLYRPAGSSIHRLLPWDKDNTFADVNRSIFARTNENVLVDRALGYGDLRALYLDVLDECARSAADGDWLANQIERLAALASGPAGEDTLKQFSTEAFQEAVDRIRRFAAERSRLVLDDVARARADAGNAP
jgi:spore coat protein CotH